MGDADGRVGLGGRCTSPSRAPTNHAEKFRRWSPLVWFNCLSVSNRCIITGHVSEPHWRVLVWMSEDSCVLQRALEDKKRRNPSDVCLGEGYTKPHRLAATGVQDMDRQFLRWTLHRPLPERERTVFSLSDWKNKNWLLRCWCRSSPISMQLPRNQKQVSKLWLLAWCVLASNPMTCGGSSGLSEVLEQDGAA